MENKAVRYKKGEQRGERMEKNEVLIIESDKDWISFIKGDTVIWLVCMVMIGGSWGGLGLVGVSRRTVMDTDDIIGMIFIVFCIIAESLFLLLYIYRMWLNIGRKLILDKTGILVKLWFYEKKYSWDDFRIRQLRKKLGKYCYDEGLLLAVYKHPPRQNSNCELFTSIRHPFGGGIVINFKMHRPILVHEIANLYINGEMMAAEKEELLSKLKEWGVDFETERPKNFDIFQDKKGRLQSRRNGTAWILLAAAIWLLLLGFIIYPIFIWKNPVLIAIFIPFFIALVPVYVVITSRKSYRLKMDEKGCIRKFLFLSKRYRWKDLRVKLIASEESHCGEGVLFIKKKSGNSGSASETFSYASLHPYSSFVANFEVFGKMYGEKDALHEISKELFLEKMKEWGVEVEGLPKEER